MYQKFFKRLLDFLLSLIAIIVLSPIFVILTLVGAVAMGGNPFFVQPRPGIKDENGNEKIFNMLKFRSMDNRKDKNGNLLPDHKRLNRYGKMLRASSLDELPGIFNILLGDMSIVGPRPQLVRDMTFMTEEQRRRHSVRPGLTGLAQVNGRNTISWEQKFKYDLMYIENGITFRSDLIIILKTVETVFGKKDSVREGTASDLDLGDWLISQGKVTEEEYNENQERAKELLGV